MNRWDIHDEFHEGDKRSVLPIGIEAQNGIRSGGVNIQRGTTSTNQEKNIRRMARRKNLGWRNPGTGHNIEVERKGSRGHSNEPW